MIGSLVRRAGFWTLDAIGGGYKHKVYQDIQMGNVNQEKKLDSILKYARIHVPFYTAVKKDDLSSFPVMTKTKYRELGEREYTSDEYLDAEVHNVYTSGSTGTPFHVIQDKQKRVRVNCDLIYCHEQFGWKLGDHYIFIRNWVSNYTQSRLKSIAQNVYNVNIVDMNEDCKDKLIEHLRKHKKSVVFGYASAIYELAVYVSDRKIDGHKLSVKVIVCDSDALTSKMRTIIKEEFGCPVVNRYDNEENGLLGVSRPDEDRINLNTASLYFELLKLDSDDECQPGEIGRVVVTDLFNKAMPLIRYDTGDLAVSNDMPRKIRTIESLYGRTSGSLTNTEGRLVSDVAISGAVEPFTDIKKYQIEQKGSDYLFKYVGELNEKAQMDLNERFVRAFGHEADIKFEQVQDIPVGKNGKFKTTIRIE